MCCGQTDLAQFGEVDLESLRIIVKAESNHGVEDVLASDGLALLHGTALRSLARDERNKLGYTFLHAFLGVLCDLGCPRN